MRAYKADMIRALKKIDLNLFIIFIFELIFKQKLKLKNS